jgi:hypothetical protein
VSHTSAVRLNSTTAVNHSIALPSLETSVLILNIITVYPKQPNASSATLPGVSCLRPVLAGSPPRFWLHARRLLYTWPTGPLQEPYKKCHRLSSRHVGLLSVSSLANLLWLDNLSVRLVVDALHAVLDVPEDDRKSVQLLRLSFQCHLVDKKQRLGGFCILKRMLQGGIASMCMKLMLRYLHRDMCDLQKPRTMWPKTNCQNWINAISTKLRNA